MEKNSSYYPETKMKMKHLSAILDNSAHFKIAELILVRYNIYDVYTQNSLKKISELIIHVLIIEDKAPSLQSGTYNLLINQISCMAYIMNNTRSCVIIKLISSAKNVSEDKI